MSNKKNTLLEYYFPEDDDSVSREMGDTRRPRLTLRHLNKIRKVKEMRKLETAAHKEFVQSMYGSQEDDEGDMPGF